LQGERAEHATPDTLSTIVDHTLFNRMNQQAFFTREVQPHKHPTDVIRRPRVVHDAFQVQGTVNHVASDGTDIQYGGSSSIELEGVCSACGSGLAAEIEVRNPSVLVVLMNFESQIDLAISYAIDYLCLPIFCF
nr:hypothetical protein [Tanacetum cinerariifolium]